MVDYLTRLQDDPTIIGIHVVDEPTNPWAYGRVCRIIKQNGLCARLNFLPSFATWVFENYQGHVEDTIIATGRENYSYLSYDQYPLKLDVVRQQKQFTVIAPIPSGILPPCTPT